MHTFARLLVLSAALAVGSAAGARSSFTASFAPDPASPLLGTWSGQSSSVQIQEVLGEAVDPVTGEVTRTWGLIHAESNTTRGPSEGGTLGRQHASVGPGVGNDLHGVAAADIGAGMSAHVFEGDRPAQAHAWSMWSTEVALAPNESFTFSGVATLSIVGSAAPLVPWVTFEAFAIEPYARLQFGDERVSTGMFAALAGVGTFSHAIGPDGFLSISVTNRGAGDAFATFSVTTSVSVLPRLAAPVPEPGAWLLMAAGLAVLSTAKRRTARASPATMS